jgi:hypothetical protein
MTKSDDQQKRHLAAMKGWQTRRENVRQRLLRNGWTPEAIARYREEQALLQLLARLKPAGRA